MENNNIMNIIKIQVHEWLPYFNFVFYHGIH